MRKQSWDEELRVQYGNDRKCDSNIRRKRWKIRGFGTKIPCVIFYVCHTCFFHLPCSAQPHIEVQCCLGSNRTVHYQAAASLAGHPKISIMPYQHVISAWIWNCCWLHCVQPTASWRESNLSKVGIASSGTVSFIVRALQWFKVIHGSSKNTFSLLFKFVKSFSP